MNYLKNIQLYLTLLVCMVMLSSCETTTDWERQGLKGNVKSYTESNYAPEKDANVWKRGTEIPSMGNQRLTFDEKGTHTLRELLHKDNSVLEKTTIERNDKGNIVQTSYDDGGTVVARIENTYQSDDKIEFVQYDGDNTKLLEGVMYLENNKVVKQDVTAFFGNDNGVTYHTELTYNDDGYMIAENTTRDGEPFTSHNFKYVQFDEQNNWIERLDFMESDPSKPIKIVAREYVYYNK